VVKNKAPMIVSAKVMAEDATESLLVVSSEHSLGKAHADAATLSDAAATPRTQIMLAFKLKTRFFLKVSSAACFSEYREGISAADILAHKDDYDL